MPTSIINPNSVVTLRAFLDGARHKVYPDIDENIPFQLYQDLHPETRSREALTPWLNERFAVYDQILNTPRSAAGSELMERAWVHTNTMAFLGDRFTGFDYLHDYVFNDEGRAWVVDAFEFARYGNTRAILHDIIDPLTWGLFILLDSPRWTDAFLEDLLKDRYMPFLCLVLHMTTDLLGAKNFGSL